MPPASRLPPATSRGGLHQHGTGASATSSAREAARRAAKRPPSRPVARVRRQGGRRRRGQKRGCGDCARCPDDEAATPPAPDMTTARLSSATCRSRRRERGGVLRVTLDSLPLHKSFQFGATHVGVLVSFRTDTRRLARRTSLSSDNTHACPDHGLAFSSPLSAPHLSTDRLHKSDESLCNSTRLG